MRKEWRSGYLEGMDNVVGRLARQAEHTGFVVSKRSRFLLTDVCGRFSTVVNPLLTHYTEYRFDPQRYRRSFIVRQPPEDGSPSELPRRVFVVWTGDNELTPHRAANLERLRDRIGVPVELVSPRNLEQWIVEGHSLHPAYEHLSLVHRSDYLRAYLLHHHGGGYCDLKAVDHGWTAAFDRAEADPGAWVTGYVEKKANDPARVAKAVGADIRRFYDRLVGCGAMIARSHTDFTGEWMREGDRLMDHWGSQLEEFPGGVRGEVTGYPVSWTDLLGKVFHPLQLKHLGHVRQDEDLTVELHDYQ